jgi:AcrB/AcrD/AcrF family
LQPAIRRENGEATGRAEAPETYEVRVRVKGFLESIRFRDGGPVEQYPSITPPTVQVVCNYPGASAKVVADTVAAPIEQQVNGVENMLYMSSTSGSDGSYALTVTFDIGTNIDTAQVLVQNRVASAEPLLPEEIRRRNMDWVEGNLRKVHQATGGRVAYVYVPNTPGLGHAYFKRYFFPQADKQAIIVDARFNGGGQIADYYIDHLRRPFTAMWATRYGEDLKTPAAAIMVPKVMIIDETAGSGATCCRGCSASTSSDRWSASAPGAASSACSSSLCSWTAAW